MIYKRLAERQSHDLNHIFTILRVQPLSVARLFSVCNNICKSWRPFGAHVHCRHKHDAHKADRHDLAHLAPGCVARKMGGGGGGLLLPSDPISTMKILNIEILFLTNQISVSSKSVEKRVWSQNVALLRGYHRQ